MGAFGPSQPSACRARATLTAASTHATPFVAATWHRADMFQPNANLEVSWRNDRLCLRTPGSLRVWRGWPHVQAMRCDRTVWRLEIPPEFDTTQRRLLCETALRWWEGRYGPVWEQGQAELPLGPDLTRHFANASAWHAFFATFPPSILHEVRQLSTGHWRCLQVLASAPGAMDLLTSNPGLLWLVAHRHLFAPRLAPLTEAARLVRLPQRAILIALEFPDVPGLDRIVRRVDPIWLSYADFAMRLRQSLRDPMTAKLLRHDAANFWRVNVLTDPCLRPWLTPQLLNAFERDDTKTSRWLLRELGGAVLTRIQPTPLRTVNHLQRWVARIADESENRPLPPPPLPPRDSQMVPLTDINSLRLEGQEMRNCLAQEELYGYVRQIDAGEMYVYRLNSPRMTLAIAKQQDGHWTVSDLRGPGNVAVQEDVAVEIGRWLSASNGPRATPTAQATYPRGTCAIRSAKNGEPSSRP